jgi:hypothetical protein
MKINDGGSAFPVPGSDSRFTNTIGMSLRDWFAGQALAGLSNGGEWIYGYDDDGPYVLDENTSTSIGDFAYRMADAMIAARDEFRPESS